MQRFSAWASLLASVVILAACGGVPDSTVSPNGPDGIDTSENAGSANTNGGRSQINTGNGAGNSQGGSAAEAGADDGPECGNGKLEGTETCDDGNSTPGDGCDGNCNKNANWDCPTPGAPCTYNPKSAVCGNGQTEAGEQCDLGSDASGKNLNDGSIGCLADCTTEPGWTCPPNASCTKDAYCGDKMVQATLGEQCDDGINSGANGCDPTCHVVKGYKCPQTGGACALDPYCGNGVLDPGEQCDDHNLRSYDGCSATCFLEAGFSCPPAGGTCMRICGNGVLDAGETCDDSNFIDKDGCSSKCATEPGWTCSVVGQPCVYTPPPPPTQCGNGVLETGEGCDDGNTKGGDGCSSVCALESGYKCSTPNTACVAAKCGDGILAGSEQCDDGKVDNVHGCSTTCTIVAGAVCPSNGGLCIPQVCGDGKVTGSETCDDGLNDGKTGCSTTCQIIAGWACPLAGTKCVPICGDGVVVGNEQCDEKGDAPCCTTTCTIKAGYVCDPSKPTHSQVATTYCGNGTVNGPSNTGSTVYGSEQCDDGNNVPFDGCSPTCTNEPLCGTYNTYLSNPTAAPYQCFAKCGDGLVLPPEQCDDGNALPGDGCDQNCKIELIPNTTTPAFTCTQPPAGALVTLPVIWRDFTPRLHPQFSVDPLVNRRLPGMTLGALQAVNIGGTRPYRYVPQYNTTFKSPTFPANSYNNLADWTMNGPGWTMADVVYNASSAATLTAGNANALLTPAGRFKQWYLDDATVNKSFASTITLKAIAGGAFQYSCDDVACDSAFPAGGFFPLDGKGWIASNQETSLYGGHNFNFSTEVRSWFAFKGGEKLAFYGDDDVWVFVNGQLVLDIGGIHSKVAGNFTLNATGSATSCVEDIPGDGGNTTKCTTVPLALVTNNIYEIAIFNAERHISQSNFQLTLTGFNSAPSVCTPICGDGYSAGNEQCDNGAGNVAPTANTYGKCTTECKLGPYCGDAKPLIPPEVCDNGLNIDAYTISSPSALMCGPGCVKPAYCGDGVLQKVNGEECDDAANNQNTYGHCQTNCKLGPRCGDGTTQPGNGETCDDGAKNGSLSSLCDATCHLKCGNKAVDAGEQCDDGTGATGNGSDASACSAKCVFKCGDGLKDKGEDCDDGKNDGSYGTCKSDCKYAPYCGDGTLQTPQEVCDKGSANSSTAYGPNSCTDQCLPGGTCGDGVINGSEKCDDGKNTGLPGSCKVDCSGYVPSTQCGDGTIQAPEKCDDGTGANGNGTAASKCDTLCRFKCGNGLADAGEQCDNGVNDGSYGTCKSDCTLAGYCGDGTKNGNEQCDLGANNVASGYGVGVCTKACKAAPFCGDGKIQQPQEQCEGNQSCFNCQPNIVK